MKNVSFTEYSRADQKNIMKIIYLKIIGMKLTKNENIVKKITKMNN